MSTPLDLDALVAAALAHPDDESPDYWDVVHELRLDGGREALERMRALATSVRPEERALAADVLAQLGPRVGDDRPLASEALPTLLGLLDDPSPRVLKAAISALGHITGPAALPRITTFATHPDDDVRWAVTSCLGAHTDAPGALATLITLTRDASADVRDWATFGIGTLADADTPEIREALVARLDDEDDDTRLEAVAGLAKRRDPRVVPALGRVLDEANWGPAVIGDLLEAAADFASSALVGPLEQCCVPEGDEPLRVQALDACRDGRPLRPAARPDPASRSG